LKEEFRQSLLTAYTPAEVEEQLLEGAAPFEDISAAA